MQSDNKRTTFEKTTGKLLEIWSEQRPGFVLVVATQRERRKEHWLRSDDAEHIARVLAKYDGSWQLEFTPTTFSEPARKRSRAFAPRLLHAELWEDGDGLKQAWTVGLRGEPWRRWQGDWGERVCLWKAPKGCALEQIEFLNEGYLLTDEDDFSFAKVTTLLPVPRDPPTALDLVRRFALPLNLYMGHVQQGKRSDAHYKIAMECMRRDLTADQARVILEGAESFIEKRSEKGNRWAEAEINRLIPKCRNVARHEKAQRV